MSDSLPNTELMMLASQIYVRLRRCNGRIVDAVYMVKNEAYAREIIALAMQQSDMELQALASRYEGWLEPEPPVPEVAALREDPRVAEARAAAIEAMMMMTMPPTPLKAVPKAAPPVIPAARTPTPAPVNRPPEPAHAPTEEEVAQHYIGALR